MPNPQTAKVTVDGKKVDIESLPEMVEFKKKEITPEQAEQENWLYDSENIVDFSALSEVNHAINQVKLKRAVVNRRLKVARKTAASAKYFWERAKRRQLIASSATSDKMRQAMAEIYTEELETEYIVASTEEEELKSLLRNLVKESEDLKELSYNIRREIDLQ
jgi:hypothetical protein